LGSCTEEPEVTVTGFKVPDAPPSLKLTVNIDVESVVVVVVTEFGIHCA